jgi:hypothetical protein
VPSVAPAELHRERALQDHEELIARITVTKDDVAAGVGARSQARREGLQRRGVEAREAAVRAERFVGG